GDSEPVRLTDHPDQSEYWWSAERDEFVRAIEQAEQGKIEPLRKKLTELAGDSRVARFINLPKLQRGVQWSRRRDKIDDSGELSERERVNLAVGDVFRIRRLWRHYFKKGQRRASDGWTAVEFAAKRWGVSEEKVTSALK